VAPRAAFEVRCAELAGGCFEYVARLNTRFEHGAVRRDRHDSDVKSETIAAVEGFESEEGGGSVSIARWMAGGDWEVRVGFEEVREGFE
jgi:hypothetical protein